jgi:chemotaxis protein methyltransferase CheR
VTPAFPEVERFRLVVARRLGLQFEDGKLDFLAGVLRERVAGSGAERVQAYLHRLGADAWREEWRALAERLTVTETYFFRNPDHFRAFGDTMATDLVAALSARREPRILSAGCASGEEPYTLAILLSSRLRDVGVKHALIRGIDANPAMVDKAAQGRYSAWSLRETPDHVRETYFRAEGRDFVLDDRIRRMVSFEERNLVEEDPAFFGPGAFDVVFCRNVTMYFTPEVTRAVIARIARSLAPGGYLFLGHAETLRGLSQEFRLCHTHDTFYYRKRDEREQREASETVFAAPAGGRSPEVLPEFVDSADSWVDAIQRASDRIALLTRDPAARPGAAQGGRTQVLPPGAPAAAPRWDLGSALELLRHERFAEAMAFLRSLPAEAAADPDTQLLCAAVLTQRGDLDEAQRACARILAMDGLNAGAHYLMALGFEHAGQRQAAVDADQAAAYLDPGFAMPHLHLGLIAKRAGDLARARDELAQALILLGREDGSRILLFGSGFTRETLAGLCRAELGACGGGP